MNLNKIKHVRSLTYVPNKFCNLGCRYCYLGTSTNIKEPTHNAAKELEDVVETLISQGVLTDRFILHGAEITAMPIDHLEQLFEYIFTYRDKYMSELRTLGSNKSLIHIKTNLYNFDKIEWLLKKYAVSISGSFDLPFETHAKYRVTKNGSSTLDKIINNIKLLKDYQFGRHLSCVVTKEVFNKRADFVRDIKIMHEDIGFDMINEFYVMFSYDSKAASEKFSGDIDNATMLSQEELVEFYNYLKESFKDTEYMKGIKYNWFKEFLPEYCTFRHNCHESLLIQKNGDVYPCHRAQPRDDFKFGNIHTDSYDEILANGYDVIKNKENENKVSDDCLKCGYFSYCYLNCTLVRNETQMDRSYTCSLQKELYKDSPERFPLLDNHSNKLKRSNFLLENNTEAHIQGEYEIPYHEGYELTESKNYINTIIGKDKVLNTMYAPNAIKVIIDGETEDLVTLKTYGVQPAIKKINKDSKVKLAILKDYFKLNCGDRDLINNNLMLIMIRDTKVVYGSEQRTKQEHIANMDIYYSSVVGNSEEQGDYFIFDITSYIDVHKGLYMDDVFNTMFITTKEARKYHYEMQANNAFYHIQAINLPFHRFNFKYNKGE